MGPLCMRIYHCSIMHGRLEFDPHNVQEAIAAVRIICVQCFYWESRRNVCIGQVYPLSNSGYFMTNKIGSGQFIMSIFADLVELF